jgi:hypothetical protein
LKELFAKSSRSVLKNIGVVLIDRTAVRVCAEGVLE